ncbi:MAG: transglycosylase domain-containing protein [Actinomycetota bacterium]
MRHRTRRLTPVAVCVVLALFAAACAQLEDLPTLSDKDLQLRLAQSSMIFDHNDRLMTTLHGEENRTLITDLDRVPERVQRAVIAIEDERFYQHEGIDLRAILRAAVENVSAGEIQEGGSTITQQYVKNVIIAPGETAAKTLERKIQEAALARQLEKKFTKEEILLRYLNTVYFGQGAYGLQAAAKTFFGKPARRLNLSEAALLAGLIRAPALYDPYTNREAAVSRRDLVLDKMVELGWAEPEEAGRAKAKKLGLRGAAVKDRYPAPYFIDYVQRLIKYDPDGVFRKIGKTPAQRERALFQGGLRVYTTVDLAAQAAAERAVRTVLPYAADPHAALVAVEPDTGYVRAMVGGRDWFAPRKEDRFAKLNLAIAAEPGLGCVKVPDRKRCDKRAPGTGRQAGSAFKPFALAAAIEEGIPLAKTFKAPACLDFAGADADGNWHVCNYAESEFGGNMTLLEGTVWSVNVVFAQLILEVGADDVVALADAMGINTELAAVNSAVLGANPVNALGMASAYGTFATNGVHHPPVAIRRIEDAGGRLLYRSHPPAEQVLEPAVAYLTTTALEQVIQRGTGSGAAIGRPVAGKTGTAQEYRDAWFAGYTPDLAAAVWTGYPERSIEMKTSCFDTFSCRPTRISVTGGSWPAQIWQLFMFDALSGVPASSFTSPGIELVSVTIDTRTNCLASRFTPPQYRQEATYPAGAVPEESCRVRGDAVKVPGVFGFPVGDAVRVLEGEGFVVEQVKTETTTYPPGRVVGQNPPGGTNAPTGSTVVIEVSVSPKGGPETGEVPSVLGHTRADAEAILEDHGYEVAVIVQRESNRRQANKNRGRVWKQSPASGTNYEKGKTVTIWVNPD